MNKNIEALVDSLQFPYAVIDDDDEVNYRNDIANQYLSYEEKIYTGERYKEDSLKKIHDYAKVWGARNALSVLLEWILCEPAQGDFDDIVDPDEEPDMVTGENRNRVLDMFNQRFEFDEFDDDIPKMINMFNVLVDEMLSQELSDHDLEMVAIRMWETSHSEIG